MIITSTVHSVYGWALAGGESERLQYRTRSTSRLGLLFPEACPGATVLLLLLGPILFDQDYVLPTTFIN